MNKIKIAFFSAAAVLTALTSSAYAETMPGPAENKVIVVVADHLSIEDISRMEYLSMLAGQSHVALMSNRQPGKACAEKSKLIIGSGKRLELNESMTRGGSGEEHLNNYRIASGNGAVSGSLAYIDIYKLRDRNSGSEFLNYIGYLGDAVNENNGAVCFLGNADTHEENRSSMLIAVDSSGLIDLGETEGILKKDKLFPYGKRTDYNKLAELYKQYLPASSFMVVETGDTVRLESFSGSLSQEVYSYYRRQVLEDIDGFVERLVDYGGFSTLVFISTYPSKQAFSKYDRLTPVIVYGTGEEGLLYSNSTRREGIVLNTDIADYLLKKLGYKKTAAVSELNRSGAEHTLRTMNEKIVKVSESRSPVLTSYAVQVIIVLCLVSAWTVYPVNRRRGIVQGFMNLISCAILTFPAVFLFLPVSHMTAVRLVYPAAAAAASLCLAAALQILIRNKIKVILSICLLLLGGLTVDILAGSPMMKQSVLGYDPVIGARFYGIGNEYAGIFIGCSLMAAGCIKELAGSKFSKEAAVLFFTACTLLLGLFFMGANFGGALAGAAGYLLAYFLLYGIKFNRRNICAGMAILAFTAAFMIGADSLGLGSPSHMGRLVEETGINGPGVVLSTIVRKISMNLRLIRYTIWTKVLLIIIAVITFIFWKPAELLRKVFSRYKYLKCSWIGIAASAITGFAVNDSGIVVAATAMIYTAFTMLVICMEERDESGIGIQDAG